jgi:hypothetical protein
MFGYVCIPKGCAGTMSASPSLPPCPPPFSLPPLSLSLCMPAHVCVHMHVSLRVVRTSGMQAGQIKDYERQCMELLGVHDVLVPKGNVPKAAGTPFITAVLHLFLHSVTLQSHMAIDRQAT